MAKSTRELELIIMRLKSQLEAKDEQIKGMDQYIREATDDKTCNLCRERSFLYLMLKSTTDHMTVRSATSVQKAAPLLVRISRDRMRCSACLPTSECVWISMTKTAIWLF